MDKTEQLFIRACKSKDSYTRLKSVYKRYYLYNDDWEHHTLLILSKICDKYLNLSVVDIISGLAPGQHFKAGNYTQRSLDYLIIQIAHTEIKRFEGLSSPRRFR